MTSDDLAAILTGNLMVAAGTLIILLGGLCTGWIMGPATVEFWDRQGLRTLVELWPVLVGGTVTMTLGLLLARGGRRKIRGAGNVRSGTDDRQ